MVQALGLLPYGKGGVTGIGGDQVTDTYLINIGLSNGEIIHNLEVFATDIEDYDLLLGMDIITETDFVITNADDKTTFQFRTPSEGRVELG